MKMFRWQTANIEPHFHHSIFEVQCNEGLILDDESTATDVHGHLYEENPLAAEGGASLTSAIASARR
jgi:hypothetical protein